MKIENIYFDMDGVLADFDRGLKELGNFEKVDQSEATEESDEALWNVVRTTPHFYDRLEPMPGAVEMFRTLYDRYGDKCEILSAMPKPHRGVPSACEDKVSWARRNLSELLTINLVYRAEKKYFVKGKGSILIDDYDINIREWTKLGGTGILFTTAEDCLRQLEELVKTEE